MASYGMYSVTPSNFGGGLIDWLPNADTAMKNANAASEFVFNMQARRAASEAMPMRLWADQNQSNASALENMRKSMALNDDIARAMFLQNCANNGGTVAECQAEFDRRKQAQQPVAPAANPAPAAVNYNLTPGIDPALTQAAADRKYGQRPGIGYDTQQIAQLYSQPALRPISSDTGALGKTLYGGT